MATTAAGAGPARADTPDPGPATVTQDALPTVQVNGVVWAQVTVGTTVYATGSFTSSRPPGSPAGTNETPRGNIIAYDITTGNPIASFNHTLNAQGFGITASPDGSRVYVVGDFTSVDGVTHNRIAAFNTADNSLVSSFTAGVGAQARAVTATNSTVYVGGNFFSASGKTRTRLAAFTSAGALLSWAPKADDNTVNAMVLSPDQSRVVVGGKFSTVNGVQVFGLTAIDAATAAVLPFAINQTVQDYGNKCGILSLRADATQIYGSGFAFGCGNFEGTFAADATTGAVKWINDCHGDTYDTLPVGPVLYSVSHAHDCSATGNFPDTDPRTWHRALASSTAADPTITNTGPDAYGWNYNGIATSTLLHWYPDVASGSYTGQYQGGWSLTGNANYVAMGGEFPKVNGVAQQGLVRFAVHAKAPNAYGPKSLGVPFATQQDVAGPVVVTATTAYDPDDAVLTYQLLRDGNKTTPVASTTLRTVGFWQQAGRPSVTLTDPSPPAGSHTYQIRVVDPGGSSLTSAAVSSSGRNYALGQATSQSSTAFDGASSRAVDGNTDGAYPDGSVTHTNTDPYSWWQVDLGLSRNLSSISVWNRTDCCADRLSDYWVFVSATPFDTSLAPSQQAAAPGVWSVHQSTQAASPTRIPASVTGRYVMVQENTQSQNLSLAEVQAFGPPGQPTNYAIGQAASQSSAGLAPASRAVDGNTDGAFWNNSVTHTADDPYSWWQVDLGANRTLSTVAVWNRTDCCGERLSDYWVFVSATPFDTSLTPGQQAAVAGVWSKHQGTQAGSPSTIPAAVTGRYVMVQQNTPKQVLSLAEVQALG